MLPFLFVAACSLSDTLIARNVIDDKLNPLLTSLKVRNYELSPSCPLKNLDSRDMLRSLDQHIDKQSPFLWECKLCNKQFRTEEAIYTHLNKKHLLSDKSRDLCMADLCHFIPCRDDTIVRHRCAAVAQQCFRDEIAEEIIHKFCYGEVEEDFWNFSMNIGIYVTMGCVSGLFCFVYYMVIWGEHEAGVSFRHQRRRTRGIKYKVKTK